MVDNPVNRRFSATMCGQPSRRHLSFVGYRPSVAPVLDRSTCVRVLRVRSNLAGAT